MALPAATGPGLAECHLSISAWMRSRSARRAMFLGARSVTMSEKPFQNLSLLTPTAGSTCCSMKSYRDVATCRLWALVRAVMNHLVKVQKESGRWHKATFGSLEKTLLQIRATINRGKSHEPMTFMQKWHCAARRSTPVKARLPRAHAFRPQGRPPTAPVHAAGVAVHASRA